MSSFLLNLVNKHPNNSSETEKSSKKVALEYPQTVVENVESFDCDIRIPTYWNRSQYDGFKLSYNWLFVENKKLGCTQWRSQGGEGLRGL
jgi:hypothetical protein